MKKPNQAQKMSDLAPVRWILASLVLVTLFFQVNLADPFNSPKSWVLLLIAAWLGGYLVSFRNIIVGNLQLKRLLFIILGFVLSLGLATFFTDFKYVAIFGDTQRRNGSLVYLSLAIIMLASSVFIRSFNINRLIFSIILISIVSIIYGTLQTTGNDFVDWNNPHNSLIGTQGNPNFASSTMAIMAVIIFSYSFINGKPPYIKILLFALVIALVFLMVRSGSRQGLLIFVLGSGVFLILWLFSKRKSLGLVALIFGCFIFIITILGMLQIGPLTKFVYKPSVSVRGFYWRAGLEMFKENPFFGVGIDRYGAYFMQYRELEYPIRYGYEITSSNAHNTFLQFFATGGIFLGISYLILLMFVATRAFYAIKLMQGNDRIILIGLISGWIAFQAQSLISIDNIGISIWNWLLGGAIVGLSISNKESPEEDEKVFIIRKNEINLKRIILSTLLVIPAILLTSILYRSENNTFKATILSIPQTQEQLNFFKDSQLRAIQSELVDPKYAVICSQYLFDVGFGQDALKSLEKIHLKDPRNLDAIMGLAIVSEKLNNTSDAIKYQEKIIKLNPWSAPTYLQLAKNYKKIGNFAESKKLVTKLLSFATGVNSKSIIEEAKKELLP